MYLDAIKSFPKTDTKLHTEKGDAFHIKTDVFKRIIWYAYPGEMGTIALSPERVAEIKKLNKDGVKPKDLLEFIKVEKVVEIGYQNVVGQDSVNRFEKSFTKNKRPNNNNKKRNPNSPNATSEGANFKGNRPQNSGQPKGNNPQSNKGRNGENKPTNSGNSSQNKGNNNAQS
jgi:hypothetical protein